MNRLKTAAVNLLWRVLPPCREVVSMISRDRDGEISGFERFRMNLHLRFCQWCARYMRQLEQLANGLKNQTEDPHPDVSKEILDRMKEKLKGKT